MTETRFQPGDSELIAAFLDGKLSEGERRELMDRLDRDEALYEVFVETVRYREAASAGGAVLDHPARFRRRAWKLPASVAALLALALVLPFLLRDGGPLEPATLARVLADDPGLAQALGPEWIEQGWSTTRGPSDVRPAADRAFRVGVQAVDLEVALRLGLTEDARDLARRIDYTLGGIELGNHLRAAYAELAEKLEQGAPADEAVELAAAAEAQAREHLDLDYAFTFGQWVEAGKLAARAGNRELLGSSSFRGVLGEIRERRWHEEIEIRLEAIDAELSRPASELDTAVLEQAFTAVIERS